MPPMTSPGEIGTFVQSVMTTLQPLCVEYHRDLTKHARRKKARGGAPAQSATSPVGTSGLSTPGWNVRYEVKQGILAEIRQEMDVADRHYTTAIDELFNAEGIFEATPSWSPRWEEARVLCDCLALRVLRCQLWNSMTTGAAHSWMRYKARMKDLIDRRGKGSGTYGWEAWEARWPEIMAQLVQRADLPALRAPTNVLDESTAELSTPKLVYCVPEKTVTTMERLPPFQNLHHGGYWLRLATRGSRARRKKALAIPEEDRVPPGQSPASAVANRPRNYDSYLVSDPHEEYTHDHVGDISRLTGEALMQFQDRAQVRMSELMRLDLAHDLADVGRYGHTIEILVPLWERTTWRDEDWHDIFAELLLLLHRCAQHERQADLVVAAIYELMCIRAPLPDRIKLDLDHCWDGWQPEKAVELRFEDKQRLCPVAVSFTFESKETHVGETVGCQLSLVSRASKRSTPLTLSAVTVTVGTSKAVKIAHNSEVTGDAEELVDLSGTLEDSVGSLLAKANLTLHPGQRRIFDLQLTFREAEVFRIKQASIYVITEQFSLEHIFTDEELLRLDALFMKPDNGSLETRLLPHTDTTAVTVLPKPPKVQILAHGLRKQYYTDELIRLVVEILNEEADAVQGEAKARIGDEAEDWLPLRWADEHEPATTEGDSYPTKAPAVKSIEEIQPAGIGKDVLLFKAPPEPTKTTLAIDVDYTLSADRSTALRKTLMLDLHFAIPFEVKFSFGPLLYRDPWPSYFDARMGSTHDQAGGIPQLWRLGSQVHSLATEDILIRDVKPIVDNVIGDSTASVHNYEPTDNETFGPGQVDRFTFELLTQKYTLDDRRPTTVESTLAITWSHDKDSEPVTTRLPVPRLTLPVSEPRVLCTLAEGSPAQSEWDATLQYHIENPSTHFLTFALTMEATEEFAFHGPKYRTLSLAPLSRHKVEYRIALQDPLENALALVDVEGEEKEGTWIWPSLQVIDSYYQKTLRVHPGGPEVKFDEKQNIGVFIEAP